MNTSVLQDPPYIRLITDTILELDRNSDLPPDEWWELFLLASRSITLEYSTQKRRVERLVRKRWEGELSYLESLPIPLLSPAQMARLLFVQQ